MIELKKIDRENFWNIIDLSVDDSQKNFVASNATSIAQSKVQPECIPLAIYQGNEAVGFVMYCLDLDECEYWIYRLMIDSKYQGRGFGSQALNAILGEIRKDTSHHKVFLGVEPENTTAIRLYESFGFKFDGRVFGIEKTMVLEY